MILTAPCHWPHLIAFWIERSRFTAPAYAIHSNGRIEVGPLTMNG